MLYSHSEEISIFTKNLYRLSIDILDNTFHLRVRRKSFFQNGYFYPISIMCFQGRDAGFFDPRSLTIGVNEKLLSTSEKTLKEVLTHEFLHYLCFIKYEEIFASLQPHGKEFQELGKSFGLGSEILSAHMELKTDEEVKNKNRLKLKVQKLMSLSQSSNAHEAKLALLKANELILKHQLTLSDPAQTTKYYSKCIYSSKKSSALIRSLSTLLNLFMLKTIIWHKKGGVELLAFGSLESLELADYLLETIVNYIEVGFKEKKKSHNLKGLKAKNQYIYGLTEGFIKKQKLSEEGLPSEEKALIINLREELEKNFYFAYPNSSRTYSQSDFDRKSYNLGKQDGKNLNINLPIKNKNTANNKLLTY